MMDSWYGNVYSMLLDALGNAVSKGYLPAEPFPGFHLRETRQEEPGDYCTDLPLLVGDALEIQPDSLYDILKSCWQLTNGNILKETYQDGWIYFLKQEDE